MKKIILLSLVALLTLIFSAKSFALCVNVAEANLRSGPGTKYEKTWDVHWVYNKLVTSKFRCAVVKVDKANVRSGPGEKFGKISMSPALKYDSFKVLKIQKPWVNVIDEFGDSGWIFRKLLWIQ